MSLQTSYSPMRVLGIDPGYGRCGIAVVDGPLSRPRLVFSACIETSHSLPHEERLSRIARAIETTAKEYVPDRAGIETLRFNKNVTTALRVAEARGVLLSSLSRAHIPVSEFTPQQVKVAVTGYGGSDKKALRAFLPRLLLLPKRPMFDDEVDAIAIALAGLSLRYPHNASA